MAKIESTKSRHQVAKSDTWALEKIFKNRLAWNRAFSKLEKQIPSYIPFQKTMKQSAQQLAALLDFDNEIERQVEKLGSYAFLMQSVDLADNESQEMVARFSNLATRIQEVASYITPHLMAIPAKKMEAFLAHKSLQPHKISLQKILRQKKHILSQKEERLLAMQGEIAGSASDIFRKLNDSDFKFGAVTVEGKKVELTQSTYGLMLESKERRVRRSAFEKMFSTYSSFENTLAETYNASVLQDKYQAKVRGFQSARERSLFSDDVPVDVYDNLIQTVRSNININHRYLDLHRRKLGLKELHFYDTYVPLVSSVKWNSSYAESVKTIRAAVAPLGRTYCNIMEKGLTSDRWVDKYENKGKRSGAFSAGAYDVPPYILLNFNRRSLQSTYTLAHEAGHSMHTLLSAKHQPFSTYDYTIFVAEVASTFNEQLLTEHLLSTAKNKRMKAYIIDREINQLRATMIRQTMFAEFEKISHEIVESGEPLTLARLKEEYTALVKFYFGPNFTFDEKLALEWARIPHFYSAFYVYKYATGLSAATALSQLVLNGGKSERDRYLRFLQSGASKYPLELLKDAGADLTTPAPIAMLMTRFSSLIDQLEAML